jgi:hypothetical protein
MTGRGAVVPRQPKSQLELTLWNSVPGEEGDVGRESIIQPGRLRSANRPGMARLNGRRAGKAGSLFAP